jgi:hypothetical protein
LFYLGLPAKEGVGVSMGGTNSTTPARRRELPPLWR